MLNKNKIFFFIFLALAVLMWIAIIYKGNSKNEFADEKVHSRQISRFAQGKFEMLPILTTLPGYHLIMAGITSGFEDRSPRMYRFASLAISLISIWIFYKLAKKLSARDPAKKTLQYIFLPISFFYFPLIYTDIFSLLLVLVSFYFILGKRYTLSAFFALAAVAVRQNNIIWAAFFWLYAYIQENGFFFSWPVTWAFVKRTISYPLLFAIFLVFIRLNRGIAIGDQEAHSFGFYSGNIYFFLAIAGFLFLPVLINYLANIKTNISKKFIIYGLLPSIALVFAFIFFPPTIHYYNLKMTYLHNIILDLAYHRYFWFYAIFIILGGVSVYAMRLEKKSLIILPFIALCLLPSFMVEQRYLIIPFVLLLLFRKEFSPKLESALTSYFFLLSASLVFILYHMEIFF